MFLGRLGYVFDLPDEPEEALGCGVLASLELVADEVLQGVGLKGSSKLAVSDFLVITILVSSMHLPSNNIWRYTAWELTLMLPCISLLTGLKAALPRTSKRVVRDSAASRNCVVLIALSLEAS